ncbi:MULTISPECIES: DUF2750 domain-containing protein [Flavobacterium]|uniref:DUF2750 domain-containing protein n=1 Tax=Flavobacterium jumunjinense TaxID=998845 RepID=A0ABV5GUN3_9FLAO|nr:MULTISPECIES: DUF2750 domain-containing protein [Flavobacterium]
MLQHSILIEKRHERFIKNVCKSGIVYALRDKEGFATSTSVNFVNDEEEAVGIICFWAEKALAISCIKEEWSKYKITEIQLVEFIENWCIGMDHDGLIIGTEFDQNMFGFEAEPLALILQLVTELKANKKELNFKNFKNSTDLEKQVKAILE